MKDCIVHDINCFDELSYATEGLISSINNYFFNSLSYIDNQLIFCKQVLKKIEFELKVVENNYNEACESYSLCIDSIQDIWIDTSWEDSNGDHHHNGYYQPSHSCDVEFANKEVLYSKYIEIKNHFDYISNLIADLKEKRNELLTTYSGKIENGISFKLKNSIENY